MEAFSLCSLAQATELGVDATQLLPDGREEGAGPLQVIQEQGTTVVTHCRQGRWVRVRAGRGRGQQGVTGVSMVEMVTGAHRDITGVLS